MRRLVALLALSLPLSACAVFGRGRTDYTNATVAANAPTTLQIARTQLEHHGFTVSDGGEGVLITAPKAIQQYQKDTAGAASKGDQWFLRVTVRPAGFTAGSQMRVEGFVIPKLPRGTGAAQQRAQAVAVTESDKALWADVRAAGRWIADEANRKGPRQSGGQRPT